MICERCHGSGRAEECDAIKAPWARLFVACPDCNGSGVAPCSDGERPDCAPVKDGEDGN